MIVHRAPKNEENPFTRISNATVRDPRLSLKARGLLALILSMSDQWDLTISGILRFQNKDRENSVRSAWRELEDAGYLRRLERGRDCRGRLLTVAFEVFERPRGDDDAPHAGLPHVDKPHVDRPRLDNPGQRTSNAIAKNDQTCTTTYGIEMEGSTSILELKEDKDLKGHVQTLSGAVLSPVDTPSDDVLLRCRDAVDAAMAKNIELISTRYWCKLDESVRKNRSFNDVFGQCPRIAWTKEEQGYLSEISAFCRERHPEADTAERVGALVRGAFRRGAKVFQILTYWVKHGGCRITLRAFLVIAGGGNSPDKRRDFLEEVESIMAEPEDDVASRRL